MAPAKNESRKLANFLDVEIVIAESMKFTHGAFGPYDLIEDSLEQYCRVRDQAEETCRVQEKISTIFRR